jgi:hypothetical protein
MPKFNPNAEAPKYELITGTFPFEIVAVEHLTSSGAKTNGLPERKVTLRVFKDTQFKENLADITDSLYDDSHLPENEQKCAWKFHVLAKCVGVLLKPGEDFDIDSGFIGFRGFAEFKPEANPKGKDPTKLWNRVKNYLTDQPAMPPRKIENPFAE